MAALPDSRQEHLPNVLRERNLTANSEENVPSGQLSGGNTDLLCFIIIFVCV